MAPNRIFVPHIHEDDKHVQTLRELLNRHGREVDISAIDSSNPNKAHNPDYIMSDYIRPKMTWCEAIVVLLSVETQGSDWIDREIDLAKQLGKRIIGVWLPGSEGCTLPDGLDDFGDAVVPWDEAQIMAAIDGTISNISDSHGTPIPARAIARHNC